MLVVLQELLIIFCRATVVRTPYDPALSTFMKKYEKELVIADPSLRPTLFTTSFLVITAMETTPMSLDLSQQFVQSLSALITEERASLRKEFLQGDCTDDVAVRLVRCGQIWQVLLQLQGWLIQVFSSHHENHDEKSEKIKQSIKEMASGMTDILMMVDVNALHGGYIWSYFIQLFLITTTTTTTTTPPSSSSSSSLLFTLLKPFQEFCSVLDNRLRQSLRLVLFDLPGIGDGFRYHLPTSIANNDHLLIITLTMTAYQAIHHINDSHAFDNVIAVATECLKLMPYRPLLRMAFFRLIQSFLERQEENEKILGRLLLEKVLEIPDRSGIASLFFFSTLVPSSSALQEEWKRLAPSILENLFTDISSSSSSSSSSLNGQSSFHHQVLLLLAESTFSMMNETLQMYCLLYLEKTLALTYGHSLSAPALRVLTTLMAVETQQAMITSFTQRLIEKEWEKDPFYQALFDLSLSLFPAQPGLFMAIAICCRLQGAVGEIPVEQQRRGAMELANMQLYSLRNVSNRIAMKEVLTDEFAQRIYLACLLQQVLYQVGQ